MISCALAISVVNYAAELVQFVRFHLPINAINKPDYYLILIAIPAETKSSPWKRRSHSPERGSPARGNAALGFRGNCCYIDFCFVKNEAI